jgi:hypothetical protein
METRRLGRIVEDFQIAMRLASTSAGKPISVCACLPLPRVISSSSGNSPNSSR